jgi:hypothetical protein
MWGKRDRHAWRRGFGPSLVLRFALPTTSLPRLLTPHCPLPLHPHQPHLPVQAGGIQASAPQQAGQPHAVARQEAVPAGGDARGGRLGARAAVLARPHGQEHALGPGAGVGGQILPAVRQRGGSTAV